MLTLPTIAQDMPAPARPDAPKGEARDMRRAGERLPARDAAVKPWRIGLMVEPITDDLRKHLDIPEKTGVVVTQILESGPAAKVGIKQNDIIIAANDRPVASIETLRESVEASAKTGKELRLSVISKGMKRVAVIRPVLPKPPMERTANGPEAKVREHEQMAQRMAEQNRLLMSRMEKQQSEINRMREAIEQLSKAVREMKEESKDQDKN